MVTMPAITQRLNLPLFVRLRRDKDDVGASLRSATENQVHTNEVLRDLRVQADRYQHSRHDVPPQLRERIAQATDELTAAREHTKKLQERFNPLATLVTRLEQSLKGEGIDPDVVTGAGFVTPPANDGPIPRAEDIESTRAHISELKTERESIAEAPRSKEETYAGVDAYCDEAVSRLERLPFSAFSSASPHADAFQMFHFVAGDDAGQSRRADLKRLEGLLIAANRSAFRQLLREGAEREAVARGGWGLGANARAARLAEIDAELFRQELLEEQAIAAFESSGRWIARRPDADPRAVLFLSAATSASTEDLEPVND